MPEVALTLQIGSPGDEAWVSRREYVKWLAVPRKGDSILHDTLLYEVLAVRHDLDKGEIIVNLWPKVSSLMGISPTDEEVGGKP
ncbi:MAG: hypothetical protein DCF32_15000 [Leptolyngbya sp.]|nr:MAG: hypothetical protein DCF32_15000 [Leptolyngbya sp.]